MKYHQNIPKWFSSYRADKKQMARLIAISPEPFGRGIKTIRFGFRNGVEFQPQISGIESPEKNGQNLCYHLEIKKNPRIIQFII